MQSCKFALCQVKISFDDIPSTKKKESPCLVLTDARYCLLLLLLQPILLPCFADTRDLHYVHRRGRPRYHIPGRARPVILRGHGQLRHHLRFRQRLQSLQQSPAGIVLESSSPSTIVVVAVRLEHLAVIIAFIEEQELNKAPELQPENEFSGPVASTFKIAITSGVRRVAASSSVFAPPPPSLKTKSVTPSSSSRRIIAADVALRVPPRRHYEDQHCAVDPWPSSSHLQQQ